MSRKIITISALCVLILGLGAATSLATDINVPGDYGTIQAAIDAAASSGDVIYVAAGTYPEQLKIDGKSLDIVGAGSGSTVVEAVDLVDRTTYTITKWTASTENIDPCIGIVGPATVNISDLKVDGRDLGPDNFYGIYYFDANGSVTDCILEGILYTASPSASKIASLVATHGETGSTTVTFSGNTIPDFQKGGILVMGPDADTDILGNIINDVPTGALAGNGIQISYGATGYTYQNTVQGVGYTGEDWSSTGILLFESGSVMMEEDEVFDCQTAVNYSDWGWIHLHPSQVALDFVGLNLHDNEWTLGTQLSRDGSDIDVDITDCIVTDSSGDGIDLWGSGSSGWYDGWDNGSLVARISGCTITNTTGYDGIWTDDLSGNATNTSDISVHDCLFAGNASSAVNHGLPEEMEADSNYWNDPDGPTIGSKGGDGAVAMAIPSPFGADMRKGGVVISKHSSSRAGETIYGTVKYSPWFAAAPGTSPMVWGTNGSIQDAIDAASSGDAVNVAAGTYREQLKIDGKSLDLVGAGIGATIIEAVELVDRTTYSIVQWTGGDPRTIDACIGVTSAGTVNVSDLTVDGRSLGPDNFYGIHFFDTSGSVTDCRVEDVLNASSPGSQKVASIVATQSDGTTAYTIDFSDNVIPNFQKGGILVMGPDMTFTVDGNDITNAPSEYNAGNGIQLSYGATGTTSGNVVHGVAYTGDDWSATGILLFECGDVSMNGDVVDACQSGVNYSNWGWIYSHPSVVNLAFNDLLLYDNEWTLGAQLSCDNADLSFAADGCMILDSTGNGIELYGTDLDPWGGAYYTGWDNGDLVADITNCVITGTAIDGIWIDDYSGNATNTMDVEVHYTAMEGSASSGLWNSSSYLVDAEYCWWGDPTGPTVITEPPRANQPAAPRVSPYGADLPEQGEPRYAERSSSRAGDGVHGIVDYDPWLGGNIVCNPDPEYLTAATSTKTIAVNYLGGGSGAMFGYSVKFSWDGSVVGTTIGDVDEGNLLSDIGGTFFYAADGTGDEIIVDCALLGSVVGATGPGTLFTIDFTGLAVGTSDIDVTIINVRDQYNNPLSGFYEDDGLLIVDVSVPTIADVEIFNTTLVHTDVYIKDTDGAQVTAIVVDDDPAFGTSDIVANLTGLGGGTAVNPGSYNGTTGEAIWTIATPPGVTCNPANGDVWVYVDATDAMGNPAGQGSDDIIADNVAPTAVTDFDAAPGNQKCDLSWTMGTDLYPAGVVVQRDDNTGDYPLYAAFKGAWPNVDAFYPGSELAPTNVYNGTGTSTADVVVDRNIYYYQAFCYDEARNYGLAATTARDLATNYWLGDVAAAMGVWGYNGLVNAADIDKLGSKYHEAPGGSPEDEMDVGPTVHPAYGRLGLPTPDDFIGFEDLMVFATNYGAVSSKVVPFLGEPCAGDLALVLTENGRSNDGLLELALRLEGNLGDVKGFTAELEFDGLEFLSARLSDEMNSPLADMFFWSGATSRGLQVDAAVLGTDVTIGGSGDVAVLTFQVLDETYSVDFVSAQLRGAANEDLTAELEGLESGDELPMVFKLVQNNPNPFNPVTKIAYHVPRESEVTVRVYDVTGRLVTTLVDGVVEPGRHAAIWNGTNDAGESVGSGVYFCTMEAPDFHDSRKMTLLK